MKKVGRNDPCPCGSGRKYKVCHGTSNITTISAAPYNAELEQLQLNLVQFASEHYQTELGKVFERYPQGTMLRDNDHQIIQFYMFGLMNWTIFNEKVAGEQTIFDIFYNNEINQLEQVSVRQTFAKWSQAIPGVYKVTTVMKEEEWAFVQSVEATSEIPYKVRLPKRGYVEGSFLIGILLPYVEHYDFIQPLLEVRDENHLLFKRITGMTAEQINDNYPYILGDGLKKNTEPQGLEWNNALYKHVADLFRHKMIDEEADERMTALGIFLWKLFTEKEQPSFRKPNGYAAAIEYVLQQEVLKTNEQTQKELAEKYETSPNSISKQARKIIDVLGEDIPKSAATILR